MLDQGLQQNSSAVYGTHFAPIKSVISLRNNGGDTLLYTPTALKYVHIPFDTWNVEESNVIAFLRAVRDPSNQPVLLHCYHGSDRTGMMVAVYRVVEQGWSKTDAITEMKQGGFGYHPIWMNLIRYIEHMDVETLKRASA